MNLALAEIELPVRLRLERPMTDEALLRFCAVNETVRVERASNGELLLMALSGGEASRQNSQITYQLARWAVESNSGPTVGSDGGFTLPGGSMRSPDAAWMPWADWNALTAKQQEVFSPICPEFLIELRSASDRLLELRAKMDIWIANGAQLAWLIDPSRKVVEIYRPGREPESVEGTSFVEGDGPVKGFVLELGRIWG